MTKSDIMAASMAFVMKKPRLAKIPEVNGLNPYRYLNVLLRGLPKSSFHDNINILDSYLSRNLQIKKVCSIKQFKAKENAKPPSSI